MLRSRRAGAVGPDAPSLSCTEHDRLPTLAVALLDEPVDDGSWSLVLSVSGVGGSVAPAKIGPCSSVAPKCRCWLFRLLVGRAGRWVVVCDAISAPAAAAAAAAASLPMAAICPLSSAPLAV